MEMTVRDWFEQRSFHYRDFSRLAAVGPAARHPAVTLILPAREVAATIGPILDTVARLSEHSGLVDQVLVIDADSADGTLVTGIWNLLTLTGLPVLAVLVMATVSRPGAAMITGAAVGLALLAAMAGGLGLLLHSEASARRAGRVLQSGLAIAARLARRVPPASAAGSLPGFRDRPGALLA